MDDLDDEVDLAFGIQILAHACGTKTIEAIVEALSNPVRVWIKIIDVQYESSPFTIYEPPPPPVTAPCFSKQEEYERHWIRVEYVEYSLTKRSLNRKKNDQKGNVP